MLYVLVGFLIFYLFQKWLNNYNIVFPALITFLFLAHPLHTEVVDSLKNRDVLLSFLGGLLTLHYVIKYLELNKISNLIPASAAFTLAFFSKPDVLPFLAIIPIAGYYFSDAPLKKSALAMVFIFASLGLVFLAVNSKLYILGRSSEQILFHENPLFFEKSWLVKIGVSFNSLFYYLRMLIFPTSLLFYYGYNTIAVESIFSPVPLITLLAYAAMGVYAVRNLKKKNIVAFGIAWYLIHISMFSNLVIPVVGIVAERFAFSASLGFCIVLAYYLLKLSKSNFENPAAKFSFNSTFLMAAGIFILFFSVKTISRGSDWKNPMTLFQHDISDLNNSAKAQETIGTELMKEAGKIKGTPQSKQLIDQSIAHYKRAVEIFPGFTIANNNLGTFYSNLYNDCNTALPYFRKAIASDSLSGEAIVNIGLCYTKLNKTDSAIYMLEKGTKLKTGKFLVAYSTLLALHFEKGDIENSKRVLNEAIRDFPTSEVPNMEMGNQYLAKRDTLEASKYYEAALKIKPDPQLSQFLMNYFLRKGDQVNAGKFRVN